MPWPWQASWHSSLCSKLRPSRFWTTIWASAKCWQFHPGESRGLSFQGAFPRKWGKVWSIGTVLEGNKVESPDAVEENSELLCCLARRHLGKFLIILFLPSFYPFSNEHTVIHFLFSWENQKLYHMLMSLESSLYGSRSDNGLLSWHWKSLMSAPLLESGFPLAE